MTAERSLREQAEILIECRAGPETMVADAARRMTDGRCGVLLVVEGERLAGMFTERDLLTRVVAPGRDPATTPIGEVMTRDPQTVPADAPLSDAIRIIDEVGQRYVPVLDGTRVLGMVSGWRLPPAAMGQMEGELERRHALAERIW